MTRYVYDFDEPSEGGRDLLGGKGIGLAEMTQLGIPVPAGFTITTDASRAFMASGGEVEGLDEEVGGAHRAARAADRKAVRRPRGSAARFRPLGGGGLDAGDDGHDPQRRAQRRVRRGSRALDGKRGVRTRLLSPADPDVRRDRRRHPARELQRRGLRRAGPGDLRARDRAGLPAGRARAAPPRDHGRLRLLELVARTGLPQHVRHPRRSRHGGQRRPDGVRQQGRGLGDRRLLHPQPLDRRARRLRGVPRQRAGRGRRRRDPHAAAARRAARAHARGVRPAPRDDGLARAPLPRHAGHRVHRRAGAPLPPADAHREADGRGRDQVRGRHDRGGADRAGRGRGADRSGRARPAAPSPPRPGCRVRGRRAGPQRLARRRLREDRARRRQRRGARQGRRGGDPRPLGDDARRHPRPHPGAGRPHGPRRDDVARGRRRARDGQAVRRRLRRPRHRHRREDGPHRRAPARARAT